MRKTVATVLCLVMILCFSAVSFAETIESQENGIKFSLPDIWNGEISGGDIYFQYPGDNETILISSEDSVYPAMDFITEEELRALTEGVYTDGMLAEELSKANDIDVRVKTNYENYWYEIYDGVKYFRFQKSFTASAYGFFDTTFYMNCFITVKNNKLYLFIHDMNDASNHFDDMIALLSSMDYSSGEIKINLNENRIYPDSPPLIMESRTMVPIRKIAEEMGYTVEWDASSETVTLISSANGTHISLQIGSSVAYKNSDEKIELDVPAFIHESRTYLPLRAVAEAMEADVDWNAESRSVNIKK